MSIYHKGPPEHPKEGPPVHLRTGAPSWMGQAPLVIPRRDFYEHPRVGPPQTSQGKISCTSSANLSGRLGQGGHCSPHDLGSLSWAWWAAASQSLHSHRLLISVPGSGAEDAPDPCLDQVCFPPFDTQGGSMQFARFLSKPQMLFVTLEKSLKNLPVLRPPLPPPPQQTGVGLTLLQSVRRFPH